MNDLPALQRNFGDWTFGTQCVAIYTEAGYEILATAPAGWGGSKKWEANARLMAAAPALLEALREVDIALKAAWNDRTLPASVMSGALVSKYEAAIAKAGQP